MQTRADEIADGIFRLSTFVPQVAAPAGFTFNQFLILGDEPLLFHAGHRGMFAALHEAVSRIMKPEKLRWLSFGHYEADECGGMNNWLAAVPGLEIAHGETACNVSLNDTADRPPRMLKNGEVIPLGGGKRVRYIDTPHVPHAWEAGILFEESTGTLLCGDLFTQVGDRGTLVRDDIVGPALAGETLFRYSSLNPNIGSTLRQLAPLKPQRLALMHGPSFEGDCATALTELADGYDAMTTEFREKNAA